MASPYLCPSCKTNKTRFNIIEQKPKSVKLDPQSGEIMEEFAADQAGPLHLPYRGPDKKIQCGVCGLIENEEAFVKRAQYMNKQS
ncbi:hypothetical protein GCM10011391_17490 [Pullulanibacillus camelliae]|uniref:DNA alkylation repair protein n=1 Tax=Pullulanibacillus camelliae TaxID=1707096 RepID=A0A8J2YGH8_9BACL|nr:DNA alkylation repair protein [Pullulanibacillus camelliae]GGE39210.1 hypothetical protein GCM10011391_17490 [Pullulanibacillus camelliae]